MTEATPSAEPTTKDERISITTWCDGVLDGDFTFEGNEHLVLDLERLCRQVDTLERRAGHVAPLMETINALRAILQGGGSIDEALQCLSEREVGE